MAGLDDVKNAVQAAAVAHDPSLARLFDPIAHDPLVPGEDGQASDDGNGNGNGNGGGGGGAVMQVIKPWQYQLPTLPA